MDYFNPENETTFLVDSCLVGIGAILTQNGSDLLRYLQTDREFLAVVYGIEHFNLYLFGSHVVVSLITSHYQGS